MSPTKQVAVSLASNVSNNADFDHLFDKAQQLRGIGDLDNAKAEYQKILAQYPNHFDALHMLGVCEHKSGHHEKAVGSLSRALQLNPESYLANSDLGIALKALGRHDEAMACFDRAIALKPDFANAHYNRANLLSARGRFTEAVAGLEMTTMLDPDHAYAWKNRGNALRKLHCFSEALLSYDRAIAIAPHDAASWSNRAEILRYLGRPDEALASSDRALSINPEIVESWMVRANILLMLGRMDQSDIMYRHAVALRPGTADVTLSHRIFALDFVADCDFAAHQAARSEWWDQIGARIAAARPPRHDNDFTPDRRIILGYVSADFMQHSAAYSFAPVLQNHDRSQFEVICYSNTAAEDQMTAAFRQLADRWRDVQHWSDDRLVECIRADKVDILIDLSGHSAGNRLRAFAAKPAPIQVTAWGHATGTGLPTMDYLFADPVLIPPEARPLFAEQICDLPCVIAIEPPPAEFRSPEPPVISNGYLTFGVFNRISKISDASIATWARIMRKDPTVRILIKDHALNDASMRSGLIDKFLLHGVVPDRLRLIGSSYREQHLAAYGQVDICLDPFPHGGGVSTCEALHMGVPVVAKIGNTTPKRLSGAILSAIGMTEWVANDDDEYVEIALRATADQLMTLRRKLPEIIATCCGPAPYTRAVEKAYQAMWRKCCNERNATRAGYRIPEVVLPEEKCLPPRAPRREVDIFGMCARAQRLHRQGQLTEARAAYQEIVEKYPNHLEAIYMLGVCERQGGSFEAAASLFRRALRLDPRCAEAHSELGHALEALQQNDEALACVDRLIDLNPDFIEAYYRRGNLLLASGRLDDAVASFDMMARRDPIHVSTWNNRGNALFQLGQREQALESYNKALALKPTHVAALINRGVALLQPSPGTNASRPEQLRHALDDFDRALALAPDQALAWTNRGEALRALGRFEDALASCEQALSINPEIELAWLFRARTLKDIGSVSEAVVACQRLLEINPNSQPALTELGICFALQADAEAAVSCFDRSLAINPDDESTLSNRIFALDFLEKSDFASHQAARSDWWRRVGAKIAADRPIKHTHDFNPNKRITLGYVSADFKAHSAAYIFRPIFRNHDRSRFEIICYNGAAGLDGDPVAVSFRQLADRWRDVQLLSDDKLAECIRADKVDVLIDLSGHSRGNRLRVFAIKPAPIQVTAWGHATGTGLPTIDYFFADPVLIPPEVRPLFAEQIYDLPCVIAIEPPPAEFRCSEPPASSNGYLTYGVFNRISKISDAAIATWARILRSDPTARLMIKDRAIDDASIQSMLLEKFAARGIPRDRLWLIGSTSREQQLATYGQVDICLDPFPHGGGVSTWEALHMGVPVVAKIGNAMPKRLSGAILSALGMTEWVASDDDEYVDIALRSTPDQLRALRRKLPDRIDARCGAVAYTRAVEAAYQEMWKKRCALSLTCEHT
jgi:predicted O-linked N-acetylglucosamine transferase (SPINDLY family)